MNNKLFFSAILCFLILLPSCARLNYDVTPHETAFYHSLRLKVSARNIDSKQKQSFKILLKYNDRADKLFFLSPLNQLYGVLVVEKENALLVNTKKKRYWQGKFHVLLYEIWGLDFNYKEFKQLLVKGKLPEKKLKEQQVTISLDKNNSGPGEQEPQQMEILTRELQLKIKISDRKTASGILSFAQELRGLEKSGSIRELVEGEDE